MMPAKHVFNKTTAKKLIHSTAIDQLIFYVHNHVHAHKHRKNSYTIITHNNNDAECCCCCSRQTHKILVVDWLNNDSYDIYRCNETK